LKRLPIDNLPNFSGCSDQKPLKKSTRSAINQDRSLFSGSLAWLFGTRKRPVELLLPGMAAWIFLSDFVLPTTRWGYYDVMILNVILAQIAVARRILGAAWPGLLAVPVMWTFSLFDKLPLALVFVPQILFLASAMLALWVPSKREENAVA
jgi:hypothetical protein